MLHIAPNRSTVAACAVALICAATAIGANANLIEIVEETTTTHTVTIVTETPRDSAEVEITGPDWTGAMAVIDGHPSVAEVTAPASPWGGPYARAKAFGDGASGETWTAFMADANGPDTYAATVLSATAGKVVTVQNLTSTTRTVTITVIFVPELAAVAWDTGVSGDLAVIYRAQLDDTEVVFEKTMTFDGTEIGTPSVDKDGILWTASEGMFIPNLGLFDHAFIMDSTPIEIPVAIELAANETRDVTISLDSLIATPDPATTAGMGFLGATSNSIPLDPYEPNDTSDEATLVACDEARFEPVLDAGDVDLFRVDAPFGSAVEVTVTSERPLASVVTDANGGLLALWSIDASERTTRRYVSTGSGDLLRFEATEFTPYTLFVSCTDAPVSPLSGDLLGVTADPGAGELVLLPPADPTAQFVAPLAGPLAPIVDVAFDPFRGVLFGLAGEAQQLVDIDPMFGVAFPICELPPLGQFTELLAGPEGLLAMWRDPNGQLMLGDMEPIADPSGICPVLPRQPLPFLDVGGLAFDPATQLLMGCTGGEDPLGAQIFGLDLNNGQMLPPLQAPGFCGGLELQQQAVLMATGPNDAQPGQLFLIDLPTGNVSNLGNTATGGLVALARVPGEAPPDSDGDGIADPVDNCIDTPNAAQTDADGDGIGNACDADLNQDCVVNVIDLGLLRLVFFSNDPVADFNGDGVVNVVDLGILRTLFFGAPGPSGLPNACAP